MPDIQSLISRVEAAMGPDRELDEAIFSALGWSPVPNPTNAMGLLGRWQREGAMTGHEGAPRYTAYLDAALRLLPDGHFWALTMRGENRGGFSACCQCDGPLTWIDAATPALALCAAALRSRAQQGEG